MDSNLARLIIIGYVHHEYPGLTTFVMESSKIASYKLNKRALEKVHSEACQKNMFNYILYCLHEVKIISWTYCHCNISIEGVHG